MSRDTETALNDALVAHLQREQCIENDELIVAWVVSYVAVCPDIEDATRQGSVSPAGQPYYVSHGLAAGLMAIFNTGMGDGGGGEDDES